MNNAQILEWVDIAAPLRGGLPDPDDGRADRAMLGRLGRGGDGGAASSRAVDAQRRGSDTGLCGCAIRFAALPAPGTNATLDHCSS